MVALIEYIAASLVDEPRSVRVDVLPGTGGSKLVLTVAPADLGKIIGRQGRTARAMRALLSVAGRKQRKVFTLEIDE